MTGMNTIMFAAAAVSLMGCLSSIPTAVAQANEHEPASGHEAAHDFHPNFLGVFFGLTDEGRLEGIALGIEYERRLIKSFGIGVLAEHTYGDLDFTVYAVPFAYHTGPWKFYVAPGIEDGDHGSEFLIRIGGEYAFEVGAWEFAPQIDVDFVDGEETVVVGITIGKGF